MGMPIQMTDDFVRALDLLRQGRSLFITGNAGTGKSTLIRHFVQQTTKNVVVAAPTGVAALNVNGYTLHRLFSFAPSTTVDEVRMGQAAPGRFAGLISQLDTLIIDEASMVRADLFDMVCYSLERYGPNPGSPLGGVQVVLVGDLYQLPPVVTTAEEAYFSEAYSSPYFFSAAHYFPERFPTVQLTHQFRQAGDSNLASLLGELRSGDVNEQVMSALNARVDPDFEPPKGEFWLTIATTNRVVRARNRRRLDALDGQLHTHFAARSGDTKRFEAPTEDKLEFKVGAQVMLLNNDAAGRWVNGSLGVVESVAFPEGDIEVQVRLRSGNVVSVGVHTWEVTRPALSAGSLTNQVVGTFTQLPFKLAWAVTIHKSQGQTLEHALIDLSGGIFAPGQLYVALSRCKSLKGIVLRRHIRPRDVKVDQRVREFLADRLGKRTQERTFLGALFCGRKDGFQRPLEVAILREDGWAFTSLVNPTRDVGDAAERYGVSAADLQLAPTLAQLWPAIEPIIEGTGVVTANARHALKVFDDELKRTGIVAPLKHFALAQVKGNAHADTAFEVASLAASATGEGGLFAHQPRCPCVSGWALPRGAGKIVPFGYVEVVAKMLQERLQNMDLTAESCQIVDRFNIEYDQHVHYRYAGLQMPLADLLKQGTRVCFTGTAYDGNKTYERSDMELLAVSVGLEVKSSVTKTRCDLLIAADTSSMSVKARKARTLGKPIYSATEFLTWAKVQGEI